MKRKATLFLVLLLSSCAISQSMKITRGIKVNMNSVTAEGIGDSIGSILIKEEDDGLSFTPSLIKITPPGPHGFHIHTNADCSPALNKDNIKSPAEAAGSHFDPLEKKIHSGPNGEGHKGDLPFLTAEEDGTVTLKIFVKNLTLSEIKGRSLMIHAGGDNYSDVPKPLGGGGTRIACGVIK